MSSPTNLTDRISHLRNRKKSSEIIRGKQLIQPNSQQKCKSISERQFATDYFMLFAYSLLVIAVLSQLALIVWWDII